MCGIDPSCPKIQRSSIPRKPRMDEGAGKHHRQTDADMLHPGK